jgi:hypothetical protein
MLRRIGLGCLLVLVLPSSTAWAAPEDERAGAEALVQAFPLDPTGERVDAAARSDPRGRSHQAVRALPESADAASGSSPTSLVLATGTAAGLLLVVGGLVTVRRRNGPGRGEGSVPLSQTGWPSTRQRILDYREPLPDAAEFEPTAIAGQKHYPDIPGRGRVRTPELPAGDASSAPPPPPVEWRSVA